MYDDDDDDILPLVIDNGSGMVKAGFSGYNCNFNFTAKINFTAKNIKGNELLLCR